FIGLGAQGYLEILAIDDEEPVPPSKRFLRLERRSPSRFIAWCARADRPLQETAELARAAGYDLGNVVTMSRKRPDGSLMSWHLTPFAKRDGVLPLYIDWGGTPNPATLLRPSLTLVSLTLVHPNPKRIQAIIDALGENEVAVERGSKRALLVNLSR
ncbi:MAG: VOC family protein, partial [Candidatus Eremiobacteraeota bacterium]|nr:VOC family protein [Candidatus Eremiobacteraeota bacterium]